MTGESKGRGCVGAVVMAFIMINLLTALVALTIVFPRVFLPGIICGALIVAWIVHVKKRNAKRAAGGGR